MTTQTTTSTQHVEHPDSATEEKPQFNALLEKKTGWIKLGSTGCSCCRHENFVSGIWDSLGEAVESADYSYRTRTLRSQYYPNGLYYVREVKYEVLNESRILIDGVVILNEEFYGEESLYEDLQSYGKEVYSTMDKVR